MEGHRLTVIRQTAPVDVGPGAKQVIARRRLEHAELKLWKNGVEMVEDIGLDAFITNPATVLVKQ